MINDYPTIFCLDVKTIGAYGDPFAAAYVVTDLSGQELENGFLNCPFEKASGLQNFRSWNITHVLPHLPNKTNVDDPAALCNRILQIWTELKGRYPNLLAIGDNNFPTNTNAFYRAIQLNENEKTFEAPSPFHEVETALMIAGIDRNQYPQNPNELPLYHPLYHARYATRLFIMAFEKVKKIQEQYL